jgi:pimeloyl-ACP methyl ester carboxylesterase
VSEDLVEIGGGITLCVTRDGDPSDPPLLLIMGLGQQLTAWPESMVRGLVGHGFHVIRFDNRDIGRSTHVSTRPPRMAQLVTRRFPPDQYDLYDMARDTASLIGALQLEPVHAVGVSMGGMIAQTLAAEHPDRVRSLVSVMSSTGSRTAGWVAPSTLRLLLRAPARDREDAAERAAAMFGHIGSYGFPTDPDEIRARARSAFDRDSRAAAGTARQIAAILKAGDRTRDLRRITAPTLVIHGDRDRMVHPSGGRATARAIRGARLETIRGLGHDVPEGVIEQLTQLIVDHARAAELQRAAA